MGGESTVHIGVEKAKALLTPAPAPAPYVNLPTSHTVCKKPAFVPIEVDEDLINWLTSCANAGLLTLYEAHLLPHLPP